MRYISIILLSLFGHILSAQDCVVCPESIVYLNGPTQPIGTNFTWTCTNGFTAEVEDTSFVIGFENVICTLTMELGDNTTSSTLTIAAEILLPNTALTVDRCQLVRTGSVCSSFRLERATTENGTYSTVIESPPNYYEPALSGWYRIANVCDCGTTVTPAVYIFKADIAYVGSCILIDGGSLTPASCDVFEVQKRCGGEGSPWETYQTGVTGPVYINEDGCCWRYICDASTGLNNYCSDVECITAPGCAVDSCALDIDIALVGCSSLSISWPVCTGSWEIQDSIAGVWSAIIGGIGTPPTSYILSGDGFYRAVKVCSPCTYTSATIDVGCYPPPCLGSTVKISQTPSPCAVSATLTAVVEDCEGAPSYLWNTGAMTSSITGAGTGTYTVTVTGCCTDPITDTYILECPPPNPCLGFTATASIPEGNYCVGGSSQYMTVTPSGGTGSYTYEWRIGLATIVSTDFDYTFIPTTVGTRVLTILITDANGCEYNITRIIYIISCCNYDVTTTGDVTVCSGSSVTWTANPSGGTPPYTYQWSYVRPDGTNVSFGSGATKTFNFTTIGTYFVRVTSLDANGCYSTHQRDLNVILCTSSCECTPTLTLSGCNLIGSFSGAGCSGFSYQLQYSPTGTGWTPMLTGTATTGFTFPAHANGVFRLLIFRDACSTIETPLVSVTCVVSCICVPSAPVQDGCQLVFGGCAGYVANLDILIDAIWTPVTTTSPYILPLSDYYSYDGYVNGIYRVRYTKSGCPTVFSSSYEVNPTEEPIVNVTRNFTSPPNDPYFWAYVAELFGSDFDNDWVTCIDSTDRVLYGLSRGLSGAATPPSFYLNTFTSSVPVTWLIEDEAGTCPDAHWSILSTTSTEAVIRFQNDPPAGTTGTYICSGSGTCRYNFRVTATDSCDRIVYVAYCVSVVSG